MTSKERYEASRLLVDFIRDFGVLLEHQLGAIQFLMSKTVEEVMDHVKELGDKTHLEVNKSDEIIVGDTESDTKLASAAVESENQILKNQSIDEKEKSSILQNQMRRLGGTFSKKVEALSTLERELQKIIYSLVGSLSYDDVIGQRLAHIIDAIDTLNKGISEYVKNPSGRNDSRAVTYLRNKILTETYLRYTTEEEKEVFHRIFGRPKKVVSNG